MRCTLYTPVRPWKHPSGSSRTGGWKCCRSWCATEATVSGENKYGDPGRNKTTLGYKHTERVKRLLYDTWVPEILCLQDYREMVIRSGLQQPSPPLFPNILSSEVFVVFLPQVTVVSACGWNRTHHHMSPLYSTGDW